MFVYNGLPSSSDTAHVIDVAPHRACIVGHRISVIHSRTLEGVEREGGGGKREREEVWAQDLVRA